MNKCFVAVLVILGLTSCSSKDEHYYQTHPNQLQQAIKACPEQQPEGLNCEQIEAIAQRMNGLAYQLQLSPQGFGSKIIALQESIANLQAQQKAEGDTTDLQNSLRQKNHDLADYLAVVKWLESPAS